MKIADQTETIAFLEAVLSRDGGEVRKIATYASLVFLGTDRALKLKRVVRFEFLDFSTPERRLRFCEAELVLNRRTAPKLEARVLLGRGEASAARCTPAVSPASPIDRGRQRGRRSRPHQLDVRRGAAALG